MARTRAPLTALTVTVLLLTGCAPTQPSPVAERTPTEAASAAPTATPTPTPTPTVESHLVVSLDGVSHVSEDGTQTAAFDDGAALLALLEAATGSLPSPQPLEGMEGYESQLVNFIWEGLRVTMDENREDPARITILAADVDGIPIATAEDLTVGSTRDEVVSAQGWDSWDDDGDGTADYLGLGGQEVPGTKSLSNPGATGIVFLLFALDGDTVTQIQVPADDFSDL